MSTQHVLPAPPIQMHRRAREIYEDTGNAMIAAGTYSPLDVEVIRQYAETTAKIHMLQEELKGKDMLVDAKGKQYVNPRHKLLESMQKLQGRLFDKLGIGPLAQQRVARTKTLNANQQPLAVKRQGSELGAFIDE